MTLKGKTFDQPEAINPDRLQEELHEALGDRFDSVDTGVKYTRDPEEKAKVIVRLVDATEADDAIVEQVLAAHKADVLSAGQQQAKDRADSYTQFISFDFEALRQMKAAEQFPIIIDLLEGIQKLMRGVD